MGSNVLEKTDYSNYEPIGKKYTKDSDNLGKYNGFEAAPKETEEKRVHNPRNAKQGFLSSALDPPREYPAPVSKEQEQPQFSPVKAQRDTQSKKL